MDRHWTLTLVALAGIAAGFALFAVDAVTLAGVVTATGAYALVFPEFADTTRATADAN
jgi:hypothetical protein